MYRGTQGKSPNHVGFFHWARAEPKCWVLPFGKAWVIHIFHTGRTERLFTILHSRRVGSIQWNYQEISLKQINKSTLCFVHAPQEGTHGMFCHERLGRYTGSASSKKDFNKFLDMRSSVKHPREQARASTAALPVWGAGMERMRHQQQPCALHWAFHKAGLNSAPHWTYRMFLPLFILIQAPSFPSSAGSLWKFNILFQKKSIVTVTFSLETSKFHF